MLCADDAALVDHTDRHHQNFIDHILHATEGIGLIISLKGDDSQRETVVDPPMISIANNALEVVNLVLL